MVDGERFGAHGGGSSPLPADLTPAELMEIAAAHRSRWVEIAVHPAAYPGLLAWLAESGDQDVQDAIGRRGLHGDPEQSAATATAASAGAVPISTAHAPQARSDMTAQAGAVARQQSDISAESQRPIATHSPGPAPAGRSFIAPIISRLAPSWRNGERGRRPGRPVLLMFGAVVVVCVVALGAIGASGLFDSANKSPAAGPAPAVANSPSQVLSSPSPIAKSSIFAPLPSSSSSPTSGWSSAPSSVSPVPVTSADRAYCQNRGVLVRLAESNTYRGALCDVNGTMTLMGRSRDVGGSVSLPATSTDISFSAVADDGTVYTYTPTSVSIKTKDKTYQQATTLWKPGTSSQLSTPGDLGLVTKISYPPCDDSAIIVYGTAWNPATDASEVQRLLDANPGSSYLRTDLSCRSFAGPSTANSNGAYVYAVYRSAPNGTAACQQIAGTSLYGRWLSNTRDPSNNNVVC